MKFKQDHVLVPSTQPLADIAPAETITHADDPTSAPVATAKTESLTCNTDTTLGRGAWLKCPSQYIQCIHAGEGTAMGVGAPLLHGVQGVSIAEVAEHDNMVNDYALEATIPTGTEPHNE